MKKPLMKNPFMNYYFIYFHILDKNSKQLASSCNVVRLWKWQEFDVVWVQELLDNSSCLKETIKNITEEYSCSLVSVTKL